MAAKEETKRKLPQIKRLYQKNGRWVYQPPQKNGVRPKPVHLSTDDLGEALAKVEDIKRRGLVEAQTAPMADLINQYLIAKRSRGKHRGEPTTQNARSSLKRFSAHFGSKRASNITTKDLLRWRDSMNGERKVNADGKELPALSQGSVSSYMYYAQSFMSWLVAQRQIRENPFSSLEKEDYPQEIPTRRDQFCTKEQRDKLIQNCDHLDLKAVLFIGFHTAMRRDELLNIRPHWIVTDEDGNPTHFRIQREAGRDGTTKFTPKNGKERVVPINDHLAEFIKENLIGRTPYLICPELEGGKNKYRWEWKRRWNTYMKKQKCEWVTPHIMKHTFVTLMLSAPPEKRPSLLHLERWCGTSSETLKKNYGHLIEDRDLINATI